jgi:hypothetical protein
MKKLLTLLVLVCMLSCEEKQKDCAICKKNKEQQDIMAYSEQKIVQEEVQVPVDYHGYGYEYPTEGVLHTWVSYEGNQVLLWRDTVYKTTPELIVKRKQQADSFANILNQLIK